MKSAIRGNLLKKWCNATEKLEASDNSSTWLRDCVQAFDKSSFQENLHVLWNAAPPEIRATSLYVTSGLLCSMPLMISFPMVMWRISRTTEAYSPYQLLMLVLDNAAMMSSLSQGYALLVGSGGNVFCRGGWFRLGFASLDLVPRSIALATVPLMLICCWDRIKALRHPVEYYLAGQNRERRAYLNFSWCVGGTLVTSFMTFLFHDGWPRRISFRLPCELKRTLLDLCETSNASLVVATLKLKDTYPACSPSLSQSLDLTRRSIHYIFTLLCLILFVLSIAVI